MAINYQKGVMFMPSERELRTSQEERLFDILFTIKLHEKGKNPEGHLRVLSRKAMSGMTADEIDAVKERVSSSYKDCYGDT